MRTLMIKDLTVYEELDSKAMASVRGGIDDVGFRNAILRGIGRGLFGDAIGSSVAPIEILRQLK